MRMISYTTILATFCAAFLQAQDIDLVSGDATLRLHRDETTRTYSLVFKHGEKTLETYQPGYPLLLEVNAKRLDGNYQQASRQDGEIVCTGNLTTENGTRFIVTDRYTADKPGAFKLSRELAIENPAPADLFFSSLFGIRTDDREDLTGHEIFVPGVWSKTNLQSRMTGVLAKNSADHFFLFREDRLPLPLATVRDVGGGGTVSLLHANANPTTFKGEAGAERITDERMQFGSIGVVRQQGVSLVFQFPGSEGERNHVDRHHRDMWALRSHPVKTGVAHRYELIFRFSKSSDYPGAVEQAWKHAFMDYQPEVRPVDIDSAFSGLIKTLDHYFVGKANGYDAPGFPFSVRLPDGQVRAYNYQMGFIGRQLPNAYFLIHQGFATRNAVLRAKGEEIVEFWARECLLPSGLPRTWYDPAQGNGKTGDWRKSDNPQGGTAMRVATSGMEGMLSAWKLMKINGQQKNEWLETCQKFGDWLASNQNEDGSYFLAYDHELRDGKHLPTESGKSTTMNPVRFLLMLESATGDARYGHAALQAGEYCLKNIHQPYHYAGSVVDNPNVIDRESGQEAIYAFLALHDASGEKRWLEAAVQAARYTETWMYAYEVPAEIGSGPTDFPEDRSIVGQTLIASGQSAADLGFAFSSFDYYRLYLFTGDAHFLTISKLLVHNTKQSMNLGGKLYPELPEGLQLEAFNVTLPRRSGIMECLSWNYAAHLDPLVRFQDTFGSLDIDTIEKLPLEKRKQLNRTVLKVR